MNYRFLAFLLLFGIASVNAMQKDCSIQFFNDTNKLTSINDIIIKPNDSKIIDLPVGKSFTVRKSGSHLGFVSGYTLRAICVPTSGFNESQATVNISFLIDGPEDQMISYDGAANFYKYHLR
ncbi:MAG: hypothetical protein M1114_02945 [Candidatus Dependentiae bacterium]|nr:hypothetical protein [Candidatus Dependentiae bacterium]